MQEPGPCVVRCETDSDVVSARTSRYDITADLGNIVSYHTQQKEVRRTYWIRVVVFGAPCASDDVKGVLEKGFISRSAESREVSYTVKMERVLVRNVRLGVHHEKNRYVQVHQPPKPERLSQ